MAYILGYITADGCITVRKDREKHPLTLNITSIDLKHLYAIRKTLKSTHKISKKSPKENNKGYQLQIPNPVMTKDLIKLGILPRKTYNLNSIKVHKKYFPDFARGFFDGDGTVYIYKVNGVSQIKAGFVSSSLPFINKFNKQLCKILGIPPKTIHQNRPNGKMIQYSVCFYIDDCEKLAKCMYGNNPTLCLPRKRQIFDKWKSIKRRHYNKRNYPSKID